MAPPAAMPPPGPQLDPVGSPSDRFALMLHDRVVDLERQVAALQPTPTDARVRVLGSRRAADTGAVFVRSRSSRDADLGEWAAEVLRTLGGVADTRWDVWCCQHWSVGFVTRPYILEALIQRGDTEAADVASAAHAHLDALHALHAQHDQHDQHGMLEPRHRAIAVEACAVACPKWFAESIRAAGAAAGRAVLHSWDPRARAVARQDIGQPDGTLAPSDPGEYAAWTMLHGWLAAQLEATDVWHPHSLNAHALGQQLVAGLAAGLGAPPENL